MRHRILLSLLILAGCAATPAPAPPVFADLDLVGYYHREPRVWNAERLAPHVSFTDSAGRERWLF